MAITNGYATANQVQERLFPDNPDDATLDPIIERIIEGVSRWIDRKTGRRIYAATETRYYSPRDWRHLIIDDLVSITTLRTDENADGVFEVTWASTDYNLRPYNAALNNEPYTEIEVTPNGDYTFPTGYPRTVEIVGSFGYAATTPTAITEACVLASMRIYERRNVLFGVAGNADLGTIEAIAPILNDGEIRLLLDSIPMRLV